MQGAACGVKARPCTVLSVVIFKRAVRPPDQRAHAGAGIAGRAAGRRRWSISPSEQIREHHGRGPVPVPAAVHAARRSRCRRSCSVLSFLVPLLAIGLGFDAINSEYNRRTLSRILAQPIYRDALLFGKFLAGLLTISIRLVTLWLLVIGLGPVAARRAAGRRGDARGGIFFW